MDVFGVYHNNIGGIGLRCKAYYVIAYATHFAVSLCYLSICTPPVDPPAQTNGIAETSFSKLLSLGYCCHLIGSLSKAGVTMML